MKRVLVATFLGLLLACAPVQTPQGEVKPTSKKELANWIHLLEDSFQFNNDPHLLASVSIELTRRGRHEEARTFIRQLLELDITSQSQIFWLVRLAGSYESDGDIEESLGVLREARGLYPMSYDIRLNLIRSLVYNEGWIEAAEIDRRLATDFLTTYLTRTRRVFSHTSLVMLGKSWAMQDHYKTETYLIEPLEDYIKRMEQNGKETYY